MVRGPAAHQPSVGLRRYGSHMSSDIELNAAVGELVQRSAILEGVIGFITFGLAGIDEAIGRIVISNSTGIRLGIIKSLTRFHFPEDVDLQRDVGEWAGRTSRAYARRSNVLHSVMIKSDEFVEAGKYARFDQGPLKDTLDIWSVSDVRAITSEIEFVTSDGISPFMKRLVDGYPHSHWAINADPD